VVNAKIRDEDGDGDMMMGGGGGGGAKQSQGDAAFGRSSACPRPLLYHAVYPPQVGWQ